jgi:excisionase family DNA binding protein
VTVETLDGGGLQVGHAALHPSVGDVLTLQQAAEMLQVPGDVVEQLAQAGELPGRRLGEEWRFARHALSNWLAGPAQ